MSPRKGPRFAWIVFTVLSFAYASVVASGEPSCRSGGCNLKQVGQLFAEVQQQIWKTSEDKIQKLKTEFQHELDGKLATLKTESEAKMTTMQGEINEAKTKLANVENNLSDKEQSILKLTGELNVVRKKLESAKDQSRKERTILRKELASAKNVSENSIKRATEAETKVKNLASQLDDFAKERQSYARNISALFQAQTSTKIRSELHQDSQQEVSSIKTAFGSVSVLVAETSANKKSISALQSLQSLNSKKIFDLVVQQKSYKKELSIIKTGEEGIRQALDDEIRERKMKDMALKNDLSQLRSSLFADYEMKSNTNTCTSGKQLTKHECEVKAVNFANVYKARHGSFFNDNVKIFYSGIVSYSQRNYGCYIYDDGRIAFNTDQSGRESDGSITRSICKS